MWEAMVKAVDFNRPTLPCLRLTGSGRCRVGARKLRAFLKFRAQSGGGSGVPCALPTALRLAEYMGLQGATIS